MQSKSCHPNPTNRSAVLLLIVVAILTACLVTPGHLGCVDVGYRLQVARSFWTTEPPVTEEAAKGGFGILGRNGRIHAWYGMGQSLLMLPADIIAVSVINRVPPLHLMDQRKEGAIERAFVAIQISTIVAALSVVVAFCFLRSLNFGFAASVGGSIALLFGTTFLNYTQNAQENNLLFLLSLTGFWMHLRWVQTGSFVNLVLGSSALGLNILVRLTTVLDIVAVTLFVGMLLFDRFRIEPRFQKRVITYLIICGTIYTIFIAADRFYHFERFGSWTSTYIHLFGEQARTRDPQLPPTFPFSTPFSTGFSGALFSLDKSVFLYDPLALLTLCLLISRIRSFSVDQVAFVGSALALLLVYACFYARYFDWSGDHAWGDRFTSVPIQMVALLAVPQLIQNFSTVRNRLTRALYLGVVGWAICLQIASVLFSYNLEIIQSTSGIRHSPVFLQRFINMFAAGTGNFDQWGLRIVPLVESRPYLLPFGAAVELAPVVQKAILLAWLTGCALLFFCLWRLLRIVRCSLAGVAGQTDPKKIIAT